MTIRISDILDQQVVEGAGFPEQVQRTFRVDGLLKGEGEAIALRQALFVDGIPKYGDRGEGMFSGMAVSGRRAVQHREDPSIVDVVVTYEPGHRVPLGGPAGWVYRLDAGLHPYRTPADWFGFPIQVQHTFPAEYPQNSALEGLTVVQGGTVNAESVTVILEARGFLPIIRVDVFVGRWLNSLNAAPFFGERVGPRWKISNLTVEPHEVTMGPPWWYKVNAVLEWRQEGHEEMVVFQQGGEVPAGLIPGLGYYTPRWYGRMDFRYLFRNLPHP